MLPKSQAQAPTLSQVHYMRYRAQKKLHKEAVRGDNDLRLMVGHANLLDSLMMNLSLAEEEQEKRAAKMVEAGRL